MKFVVSNPCDALERPRVSQSVPRGLSDEQIHRLLEVVPNTPVGLRDRAIMLTLTFTGGRRAEVLGLTAGSLSLEGGTVFYSYRGNGGMIDKRELADLPSRLSKSGWHTSVRTSQRLPHGAAVARRALWPGTTSGTFYTNLRRYLKLAGLPAGGVHIFRHSAARLRRDAGESIEEVSRSSTTPTSPPRHVSKKAGGARGQKLGKGS